MWRLIIFAAMLLMTCSRQVDYNGNGQLLDRGASVAIDRYVLDLGEVKPAQVVAAHPERAFLFIQCTGDDTVPAHHGTDLKSASANPRTELWIIDGCNHVQAYVTHPAEWEEHVIGFLERELDRLP